MPEWRAWKPRLREPSAWISSLILPPPFPPHRNMLSGFPETTPPVILLSSSRFNDVSYSRRFLGHQDGFFPPPANIEAERRKMEWFVTRKLDPEESRRTRGYIAKIVSFRSESRTTTASPLRT